MRRKLQKSLYFLIDRELFAYTDVIKLSFHKADSKDPLEIEPSMAVISDLQPDIFCIA